MTTKTRKPRPRIPGLLTLTDVAKQLKLTPGAVRQAVGRGLLKSTAQLGRSHLCTQSQVDDYRRHREGK